MLENQSNQHSPLSSPETHTDEHTAETYIPLLRRSTRSHITPSWHKDYITNAVAAPQINTVATTSIKPTYSCFLSTLTQNSDPLFFKETVKHQNWVQAMNVELDALEQNHTWVITSLPPG